MLALDDSRSAAAAHLEFNRRVSKIMLGINQTSKKLARLATCIPT
jgi:hypothetical protein